MSRRYDWLTPADAGGLSTARVNAILSDLGTLADRWERALERCEETTERLRRHVAGVEADRVEARTYATWGTRKPRWWDMPPPRDPNVPEPPRKGVSD